MLHLEKRSVWLKHQLVVDLFVIAIGFVLRVYGGAVILDLVLSSWMFVTTLSLALFIAALKRRQELVLSGDGARPVLQLYTKELIERYALMAAIGALLFYSLFVITTRPELVLTIPCVLFGFFRYWYVIESGDTLSKIAKNYLGDAMAYPKIFEANREVIKDANLIYPGQKIRIPLG